MANDAKENQLRIVQVWNIDRAEYSYSLEEFKKPTFGGMYIDPENNQNKPKWCALVSDEGREWAERTAKHYGLTIEDEPAA